MERRSPPTERVIRLLDLLARQPSEGLSLSELARRLDISKATGLGIASALTRAGYLVRSEDTKTYTLGPALLGLGRAATEAFSSLGFARPELRRLNQELGVAVSVSTLAGDKIVLLDRTGPQGELDRMLQPGQRYPYTPPSGCILATWLSDPEIEQWLADYPEVSMDESLEHLRALVDTVREHGYIVERMSDVSVGALTMLAGLDGHDIPAPAAAAIANMVSNLADRHYVARHLRAGRRYAVTFVASPSFDADGRPDLLLGLLVFRDDVTHDELVGYGTALHKAAARVTAKAGGHNPWNGRGAPKCRVGLTSSGGVRSAAKPLRRTTRKATGRTAS
jgi:DNA-binding IclR family transcriptional regulator